MQDTLSSWFANNGITNQMAQKQLLTLNTETLERGLSLTPEEAAELVQTRNLALSGSGRIEIGGGAPEKIIQAFSRSAYLFPYNYADTLNEIVEAFYYLKNETDDRIPDDDLIAFLFDCFEHRYRGSTALLYGREMEQLLRNLRFGPEEKEEEEKDDDGTTDGDPDS